jgi:hypothetical protein
MHDANKDRVRRDRFAEIVGVNPACAINRQVGHPRTETFEKPARFDDRRMLDLGRDDVVTLFAKREEHALESKVVCLAATARKNDLVVLAVKQRRRLAARRLKALVWLKPNARSKDCRSDPQGTAASRQPPPDRSVCSRCNRDRCAAQS